MTVQSFRIFLALALLAAQAAWAAPTLQTTNFIGNAYVHFNGFEGAVAQSSGAYPGGSYTEDGLRVQQIIQPGFGSSIRTNSVAGGFEGFQSWGPPGGDFGYTQIAKSDGSDFVDVGFLVGSIYGTAASNGNNNRSSVSIYYQLLDNGALVTSGTLDNQAVDAHWLGFAGGGFDEIRLRDNDISVNALYTQGRSNGLVVDSIKTRGDAVTAVPEPGGLALASLALGVMAGVLRRR